MNNSTRRNSILVLFLFFTCLKVVAQVATVITTGTPTAVTHNSATLDGNVTAIGGSPVTARGTALKTSASVTATDNPVTNGVGLGSFTTARSPLTPGTKYYYVAFATNGSGSGLSSEFSFYTLTSPPLAQPATLSASTISETQIDLSFTAPNNVSVGASGYAIYRKSGASITGLVLTNGSAPNSASNSPNNGAVFVGTTAAAADVSFSDMTATAGNQYSYALIPFGYDGTNAATYNYLVTGYISTVGYTFSTVPDNQPASVTATAVGQTQINLAFTALPSPPPAVGNVKGYVILRRIGTDPAAGSVQDGKNPASLTLGSSTLVTTITIASTASYSDGPLPALSPGTNYHYAVVPFNWDGTNPETFNYRTGDPFTTNFAITFDATSTISLISGTTTPIIDYTIFQTSGTLTTGGSANSASLGRFILNDLGSDGQPTTLASVMLTITNSANLNQIAIFDDAGTNLGQQTVSGSTVTFSGLTTVSTADGTSQNSGRFRIRATFKPIVTDQQIIDITVTSATSAGSGFAAVGAFTLATTSGSGDNVIKVTANQLAFSTLPANAVKSVNFGPLTVSAVDDNGSVQKGQNSTVTLLLQSGSGTLNPGVQSLTPNLTNGTFQWTNLSINQAGVKNIRATYSGLTRADAIITITSSGVTVTPGTVAQMCYSGDFQTITPPITLVETDPADFASGGTFSLVLPTGFVFDVTNTLIGPSISGNEIGGITHYTYPAANTVQFSYTISGTVNATLDQIVISGLKVNYTGSVDVSSANLLRFGGTAVQVGNASSDAKNYCTLSSLNSTTVIDFSVATVSGQPVVNPTDLAFQVGITSVQLVGNPTGGIFSGPGVSPNLTLGYVFSPSSVGVSTGNQITYTFTEPTAPHCKVTLKKLFDVYSSAIQGLQSQYCKNGLPTPLSVLPANIPSGYIKYDFLYYAGQVTVPTSFFTYDIVTSYNYLGTTTPAIQYTDHYFFGSYISSSAPFINASQGTVTQFDPTLSITYPNPNSIQVYYRVQNIATPATIILWNVGFTKIVNPPTVTFPLAKLAYCDYDAPVILVGSPTPVTPATDNFSGSTGIGTSITTPSTNSWLFTPTNIGTKSTSIDITYRYTDPVTNCSNTALRSIQVNPRPADVLASSIKVLGVTTTNLYTCKNSPPGNFAATSIPGTTYKWYSDAALTTQAAVPGNNFTPPVNIGTVASTDFYVTQTLLGCESSVGIPGAGLTVTANVTPPVSIIAATPLAICSSSPFDLSTIGLIGGLISGGTTTGTWSGSGAFTDASLNPSTASSTAKFYAPTPTEITNGSALITLTSSLPAAPNACPSANKSYTIPISTAITINTINPIVVCPGQSTAPIIITAIMNGAGLTQATWTSTLAQGGFRAVGGLGAGVKPFILSATSGTPVQVEYVPNPSEITSGTNIILSDINVASNSTGACLTSTNRTMALTLNAAPKVSVGANQIICADQPINLTGSSFSGSASLANWSTTGVSIIPPYSNTTNPVNATYTLDPTELNNPSQQLLRFTLTTNDPDGSGPCIAEAKTVLVTVNPIPQSPVINAVTYPNSQPAFCINDPLINNLSATGASGNTINWYTNASATGVPIVTGTLNTGAFVNNAFAGTTSFYATQKTPAGCESKNQLLGGAAKPAQFDLVINPNPLLNFKATGTSASLTGLCVGDATVLDASSSSIPTGSTIASYAWDFADGTTQAPSPSPNVTKQFKFGNYNVQLTGVSDKSCKSIINASSLASISQNLPANSPLIIGSYPITNFSVVGQCLGNGTKFTSIDSSNPKATITTYEWDFGDGSPLSTAQNPNHTFASVKTYNAKLTLNSDRGCVNAITKNVYILPSVNFTSANSNSYRESFENNTNAPLSGGWAAESFVVNSSTFSTPSWNLQAPSTSNKTIKGASEGSSAWVAGLTGVNNTYFTNEKSALNSPCFDLSSAELTKPVINFDYVSDTWARNDGAYLEYSQDNGQNWQALGSLNKGLNWYTNNFIIGLQTTVVTFGHPVGQALNQQGWDGNTQGWLTAAYSLSEIDRSKVVRFRFLFGSNKNADIANSAYEGFAIDNVFLQNSNRTVLAENFTNNSGTSTNPSKNAVTQQKDFMSFASTASLQALVKIEYHTSFGGADDVNALNPADPQARAAFYGITSSFKGFIDGSDGANSKNQTIVFNGIIEPGSGASKSNSENYFNTRSLVPSPININLTASTTTTDVTINAVIKTLTVPLPLGAGTSTRYLVHTAIVENVGGQYILRKLLPDAAGKPLTALAANSTQNISYTWQSSAPFNPANLSAICFVQDLTNKEVLQATLVNLPTTSLVTGVEPLNENDITLYPNPANQEFTLQLPKAAIEKVEIKLIDQLGKELTNYFIPTGGKAQTISTRDLAGAIYILQIETSQGVVRKKVMVAH
ncbi:MAG: PKD domain-containing protein [Cyclobacteriaceae bacterium]